MSPKIGETNDVWFMDISYVRVKRYGEEVWVQIH